MEHAIIEYKSFVYPRLGCKKKEKNRHFDFVYILLNFKDLGCRESTRFKSDHLNLF